MPSRPWSQIATNHKLRRQVFLNCRNLWLSQFVTVQKNNCSDRFHSNRGCTPKCRKHVHIKIGPFQEGFLGTSIMSFISDKHTLKYIHQWNNTKMSKNTTFHIHVKSESGYSPKYPEHVFSVIGLSLCRQSVPSRPWSQNATNHKMRRQGFLNCRNLWLSHFVTVQNRTSQIHVRSAKGYTPQCRKHVHIDVGHYQQGFLWKLIVGFITDIHTHKQI